MEILFVTEYSGDTIASQNREEINTQLLNQVYIKKMASVENNSEVVELSAIYFQFARFPYPLCGDFL